MLLYKVNTTCKVIDIDVSSYGFVLEVGIGVVMGVPLAYEVRIASYVVDFN